MKYDVYVSVVTISIYLHDQEFFFLYSIGIRHQFIVAKN